MFSETVRAFLASLTKVRRLVTLVAASAIAVWGVLSANQMLMRSTRYQRMALYCGKAEATYLGYADRYLKELNDFETKRLPKDSLGFIAISPLGQERIFANEGATSSRSIADHLGRLKRFYEKASRFPWNNLPTDLEHPRWEDEVVLNRPGDGEY
jgi:hypothetical protein